MARTLYQRLKQWKATKPMELRKPSLLVVMMIFGMANARTGLAQQGGKMEALLLLQRCVRSESVMERVSMRIQEDTRIIRNSINKDREHQRSEIFFRRDGNRIDLRRRHFFLDKQDRMFETRGVIANGTYVVYTYQPKKTKRPKDGVVATNVQSLSRGTNDALEEVGLLDGYYSNSGGMRLAELLQQATDIRTRSDKVDDGTPCTVIEGHTRYGTIALWLAEEKGCLPLKVTYVKGAQDLWYGDKPIAEQRDEYEAGGVRQKLVGWSAVLDNVRIASIGDAFVPVSGRFTFIQKGSEGVDTESVITCERTDIRLNPRFEAGDFVTELPEGSPVGNEDDPNSGIHYVWRDGKAVPGSTDFEGLNEPFLWGGSKSRSMVWVVAWLATGLLLLFFALWYIWRYKQKGA